MTVEDLINLIKNTNHRTCLYHFTDTRNVPSIASNGILSRDEIHRKGMQDVITGGNTWSFDQDKTRGVSDDVHLCFFSDHPMEFLARTDGRIEDSCFIKVLPEVLNTNGVRFCAGVANAADSNIFRIDEFKAQMDMEILFERTDWTLPQVQERLKLAKKYEILIPKLIPTKLLRIVHGS